MLDNNKRGLQHKIVSCEDGILQWIKGMKKEEEEEEGAFYIAILSGMKSLVVT
jgi:hypothetical protein